MKKLLIITGATSGIGLACIDKFLQTEDLYILAIGRDLAKITSNHIRLIKECCDVCDFEQIKSLIDNLSMQYKIVGLINGAGLAFRNDFELNDHVNHMQMVDVNIKGLTNCIELVLPIMRVNKIGTIINLSSLADRYPRPNTTVYAATKAYVKSLSDSLRLQNAKYNIRVINVSPALVDTPMVRGLSGGVSIDTVDVNQFAEIMYFLYQQPQTICIRDIVIAPTSYEG